MGDSNIFIGYEAGYNETGSNKLYIHNSRTSNPLIYGEFDNGLVTINGDLSVTGTLNYSGSDDPLDNTTVNGWLSVQDNATFQDTLTVTGLATLNGGADVNGNLDVQDNAWWEYIRCDRCHNTE